MISWLPNDWPLNTRYQIKRIQSVATKTGAPSPPTKSPGKQLHYSADFISTTCGADSTESCAIVDCRLSIVMANYVRRLRTRRDALRAPILQWFYKSNYRERCVLLELCALRQFQLCFICVLLKNFKNPLLEPEPPWSYPKTAQMGHFGPIYPLVAKIKNLNRPSSLSMYRASDKIRLLHGHVTCGLLGEIK